MYSISKRYNVQIRDIKKYNRINNNIISIGQRLKILTKSNQNFLLVDGDKIKAAGGDDQFHGYLIPNLPPVPQTAGQLCAIYWRGVI